jgi:hypothetical protein
VGEFSDEPGVYAKNLHTSEWPQKVVPLREIDVVRRHPVLAKAQRDLLRDRQHRCSSIADLSCSLYLPIVILATDVYAKNAWTPMQSVAVNNYGHVVLLEVDPRSGKFESWCCADKL